MFRDLGEEGRFVERYIVSSWAEYMRLRARMTVADRALQDEILQFQRADTPVRVSRLLGVDLQEPFESASIARRMPPRRKRQ